MFDNFWGNGVRGSPATTCDNNTPWFRQTWHHLLITISSQRTRHYVTDSKRTLSTTSSLPCSKFANRLRILASVSKSHWNLMKWPKMLQEKQTPPTQFCRCFSTWSHVLGIARVKEGNKMTWMTCLQGKSWTWEAPENVYTRRTSICAPKPLIHWRKLGKSNEGRDHCW